MTTDNIVVTYTEEQKKQMYKDWKDAKGTNVYEKLLKVRTNVPSMNKDKRGHGYSYFDMDQILPALNPLLEKHGLLPVVSVEDDYATLTIIDVDNPVDKITFTTPCLNLVDTLKQCATKIFTSRLGVTESGPVIQSFGSVQTYIRRYLYILAFELDSSDEVEPAVSNKRVEPAVSKQRVEPAVSNKRVEPAVSKPQIETAISKQDVCLDYPYPPLLRRKV